MVNRFFLGLTFLLSSAYAYATTDLWSDINAAQFATQKLNYQGIVQSINEKQDINVVKLTHANFQDQEYVKIEKVEGDKAELLLLNSDATIYQEQDDKIVIQKKQHDHLFPNIFSGDLEQIKQNYNLSQGSETIIASRKAILYVLNPKDNYRYFYHLWLDVENNLPLKLTVVSPDKKVVENISFAEIKFLQSRDLNWFRPNAANNKSYALAESNHLSQITPRLFKVSKSTLGFREAEFFAKRMPGLNIQSQQLILTDGLSYVSIYIHPISKNQKPQTGQMQKNNSNIIAVYKGGYQLMAVGKVPFDTLQMLTDAVNF
jgi:sigma-E factor negative regulatory protein RseB